jgi:hypothetical protein
LPYRFVPATTLLTPKEVTALHAKLAAHDERLVRVQDAGKGNQAEYAHSLAARDGELRNLGEKLARSELVIQEKEKEVQRYKADVAARLDAEAALKRTVADAEASAESRLARYAAGASTEKDELTQRLLEERDQMSATQTQLQHEIAQHKAVLAKLQAEKDEALQLVADWRRKSAGGGASASASVSASAHEVRRTVGSTEQAAANAAGAVGENMRLRAVIKEMRATMEELSHQEVQQPSQPPLSLQPALVQPNHDLVAPIPPVFARIPGHDDTPLRKHVQELNTTVQRLQAELREASAAARDAQAQVAALELAARQGVILQGAGTIPLCCCCCSSSSFFFLCTVHFATSR